MALNMLRNDTKMSTILQEMTLQFSYRQPPNLEILLRKKINLESNFEVTQCSSNLCKLCNIIKCGNQNTMENNTILKFNENMDCNSKYVIYCIICHCQKQYIGHTNDLRKRMNLHKEQTNHEEYRFLYVNKHLHACGNKWQFLPIFKMNNSNFIERETKEKHLIKKYQPSLNRQ